MSLVIIISAVIARYIIVESPYMIRILEARKVDKLPSISVFKKYWVPIVLLALILAFQQFDGYTTFTYIVAFMRFAEYSLPYYLNGATRWKSVRLLKIVYFHAYLRGEP